MENDTFVNVKIVFFSGTGGTKRIADEFKKELVKRNNLVKIIDLGRGCVKVDEIPKSSMEPDIYILLYPVYIFDAPKLIYYWIESLGNSVNGKNIAVISVSGGGEVWPNTDCRNKCCGMLEDRGMKVIYDNMMCMPANVITEVNDHLSMHLIQIIPEKVNKALDDILGNKINRTRLHKRWLVHYLLKLVRNNENKFARKLSINNKCNCCGWCVENCPLQNIVISEKTFKPEFLDRCMICMRCIYGCPTKAIESKNPIVLKSGYDLELVEKRMKGIQLQKVKKCCKGILFRGVKDYLLNK